MSLKIYQSTMAGTSEHLLDSHGGQSQSRVEKNAHFEVVFGKEKINYKIRSES